MPVLEMFRLCVPQQVSSSARYGRPLMKHRDAFPSPDIKHFMYPHEDWLYEPRHRLLRHLRTSIVTSWSSEDVSEDLGSSDSEDDADEVGKPRPFANESEFVDALKQSATDDRRMQLRAANTDKKLLREAIWSMIGPEKRQQLRSRRFLDDTYETELPAAVQRLLRKPRIWPKLDRYLQEALLDDAAPLLLNDGWTEEERFLICTSELPAGTVLRWRTYLSDNISSFSAKSFNSLPPAVRVAAWTASLTLEIEDNRAVVVDSMRTFNKESYELCTASHLWALGYEMTCAAHLGSHSCCDFLFDDHQPLLPEAFVAGCVSGCVFETGEVRLANENILRAVCRWQKRVRFSERERVCHFIAHQIAVNTPTDEMFGVVNVAQLPAVLRSCREAGVFLCPAEVSLHGPQMAPIRSEIKSN
eukprot:TRINITY_DN674_c0_g1_i2.p1 TRINITY_DN674_c0_g1~~TRINITY_DN674_c0_g1_i2.p1  ORF type:complete len:416 (-),score=55.74 TRINITY_DN674_c0_g1_i2:20-1267(-)